MPVRKSPINKPAFIISENVVNEIAMEYFGYKPSREDMDIFPIAMQCYQIAAEQTEDAILEALRFIIDPSKCNWKLMDPKTASFSKITLKDAKKYYSGTRCNDHILPIKSEESGKKG